MLRLAVCFLLVLCCCGAAEQRLPLLDSSCRVENGALEALYPDDWCKGNMRLVDGDSLVAREINKQIILCSKGEFEIEPGETLNGSIAFSGSFDGGFGIYCYDGKGLIGAVMPRAYRETQPDGGRIEFAIPVPRILNERTPRSVRFVMQMNAGTDCRISALELTQPSPKQLNTLLDSPVMVSDGRISDFDIDDWCKSHISLPKSAPHLPLQKIEKPVVLVSRSMVAAQPRQKFFVEMESSGKLETGVGLYLYDDRGMIGAILPRVLRAASTEVKKSFCSFSVPDSLSGRKPLRARFVLQVAAGTDAALHRVTFAAAVSDAVSLRNDIVSATVDPGNSHNLDSLRIGKSSNLLRSLGFSYYAHGVWNNESVGSNGSRVLAKTSDKIESESRNADFAIRKTVQLLPNGGPVKLDYEMTVLRDFFIGGGDPPGGIHFPAFAFDETLSHWGVVEENGEARIYAEQDFPYCRFGLFEDRALVAKCTPDGRSGVVMALGQCSEQKSENKPFFNMFGLSWPQLAFRMLKAGEAIKIQLYLMPYSGDMKQAVADVSQKLALSAAPMRTEGMRSRVAYASQAPTGGTLIQKNAAGAVFTAGSEFVLPEQTVPTASADTIRLSAARGESEFVQVVLHPNQDAWEQVAVLPGSLRREEAEIPAAQIAVNYLEPATVFYSMTKDGVRGEIPDMMSPAATRRLAPDRNHSYVLSVTVPENAAPGIYQGEITIRRTGETIQLPYQLEVFDFNLPRESHFKTAFLAWGGEGYLKQMKYPWTFDANRIVNDLAKMRISAAPDMQVVVDRAGVIDRKQFQHDLRDWVERCTGMVRIGGVFEWRRFSHLDRKSPEFERAVRSFARQVGDAVRETGLSDRIWFLMVDETHWGEERLVEHVKWCKWVKEEAPNLLIHSTQNHPETRLAEVVDVIIGSNSSTGALREKFGDRKQYWLYENGFYFSIGIPSSIPRTLAWKAYVGGYRGYHQWSVCSWTKQFYPGCFHGTGNFYYPPAQEQGADAVVRSFRLMNFAAGMDDYDYFVLLDQALAQAKDQGESDRVRQILDLKNRILQLVPDQYHLQGNPAELAALRHEIGTLLSTHSGR